VAYEDIISGQQPIDSSGGASDNWLSDLGSAVSSITSGIGSFFQNQQAIKGAMAVAEGVTGRVSPQMNYPGLGYSTSQLNVMPAMPRANPAGYFNIGPGGLSMGDNSMPMTGVTGGGSSSALAPGGMFRVGAPSTRASAQRLVMGQNPVNGKVHVWYHVGSLDMLVREGLRSCGYGRKHRRRRRSSRRP
jgi:hypothetical protein